MRDAVRGACELLGLDPLHIANEGQFLAVVAPEYRRRRARRAPPRRRAATKRASSASPRPSPPARCSSTHRTAAPASSTCWWAIRCRVSAKGTYGNSTSISQLKSKSAARPESHLSRTSSRVKHRAWRKLAARCRSASCAAAACWPSAAAPYATDAQHVSVEFVHPVIVGKRALPALDLSLSFRAMARRHLPPRRHRDGLRPARRRPRSLGRTRGCARRGRDDLRPSRPGRFLRAATVDRGSFHAPGNHRDPLPHALGDGARLLRASRTRPRRRRAGFLYPFLGTKKQETSADLSARSPIPSG